MQKKILLNSDPVHVSCFIILKLKMHVKMQNVMEMRIGVAETLNIQNGNISVVLMYNKYVQRVY